MGVKAALIAQAKNRFLPQIAAAQSASPIRGRITLSGYEGSELLVGRLLVECGGAIRYVGTACPRTRWSDPDREWLEAHGVEVRFRASLEDDLAACEAFEPDLAIGTTPVVQKAKQQGRPSLYFTNLISARPLMGVPGSGSLAHVINAAMGQHTRFTRMREFFEGVGSGDKAGIWQDLPIPPPLARKPAAPAETMSITGDAL
jgi:chlorophyllide a reductase subunit Y